MRIAALPFCLTSIAALHVGRILTAEHLENIAKDCYNQIWAKAKTEKYSQTKDQVRCVKWMQPDNKTCIALKHPLFSEVSNSQHSNKRRNLLCN